MRSTETRLTTKLLISITLPRATQFDIAQEHRITRGGKLFMEFSAAAPCRSLRNNDPTTAPFRNSNLGALLPIGGARLIEKHHIQQRAMDGDAAVIVDVAEFSEFVHEKVDTRARRTNHLRKCLMIDLAYGGFHPTLFPIICQQ